MTVPMENTQQQTGRLIQAIVPSLDSYEAWTHDNWESRMRLSVPHSRYVGRNAFLTMFDKQQHNDIALVRQPPTVQNSRSKLLPWSPQCEKEGLSLSIQTVWVEMPYISSLLAEWILDLFQQLGPVIQMPATSMLLSYEHVRAQILWDSNNEIPPHVEIELAEPDEGKSFILRQEDRHRQIPRDPEQTSQFGPIKVDNQHPHAQIHLDQAIALEAPRIASPANSEGISSDHEIAKTNELSQSQGPSEESRRQFIQMLVNPVGFNDEIHHEIGTPTGQLYFPINLEAPTTETPFRSSKRKIRSPSTTKDPQLSERVTRRRKLLSSLDVEGYDGAEQATHTAPSTSGTPPTKRLQRSKSKGRGYQTTYKPPSASQGTEPPQHGRAASGDK
ncbi:hypothetical protein R1sor_003644 [Riccia sorocarpa]|uniref:DUF4283 domain-containing protein n=1 Tax=Riccia sorocarpa TaxID=122646 RepID=A0ABD3H266_9MARC